MNDQDLRARAIDFVEVALQDAPAGHRTVHMEQEAGYFPDVKRRVSDHKFSVLAPSTDLVVFFDSGGQLLGWRDDGRKGTAVSVPVFPDRLRTAVVAELELDPQAWLGEVKSVVLPPVGWTHEAVVFLKKIPEADDVLRVWVDPIDLRIIQCLKGAGR
jgi:hypothetical protein